MKTSCYRHWFLMCVVKIPKSFYSKSSYRTFVLKLSSYILSLNFKWYHTHMYSCQMSFLVIINHHQCEVSSKIGEEDWRRWWDGESGRIKGRVRRWAPYFLICCSICQQMEDGIDSQLPPYLHSQASTAETQLQISLFKDPPRERAGESGMEMS